MLQQVQLPGAVTKLNTSLADVEVADLHLPVSQVHQIAIDVSCHCSLCNSSLARARRLSTWRLYTSLRLLKVKGLG